MAPLMEVGTYEVKTHLAELLRRVREGQGFVITHRGKPVAELVPAGSLKKSEAARGAREMKDFMRNASPLPSSEFHALIDEGRD